MNLDPILLRTFLAVEREGGFTAGGELLGLRQSTVSGHITRLEKAVGRELFLRDTRNMELTADGTAMIGFARSILDATAEAEHYFAEAPLAGRLRLGVSDDLVSTELPHVLYDFRRAHPGVDLELTVGLSETLRSKFDGGELDLVFGKRRPGETHGDLVWADRLVWAGIPGTRVEPGPVPFVTYPPPSITRSAALAALGREGRGWRFTCVTDSELGLRAAVQAGLGYLVHAESTLPDGVVALDGQDLPELGGIEFVLLTKDTARSPRGALRDAIMTRLGR
ncbi:LysR family transcriptional regulator [Rhodococcus sp. 06-156-3C]|uniref:LysR family transcriptional regulator n=1 Tax=Nocardiaceae TaxID=85025 RepID=UPI000522F07F|nr:MULTISPECIES: LysR substrate-binding domain-containing protein [Rhodococcus]OZD12181.1 LysR family transcriptional regulator [Rhodococcus sp. 06-156-3C]OZD19150.1 LysR family transcriptional regulator [Rhodococcus sp. 06-156-4C]OZD20807.1 LysR family transcriptional regulator [Rhodococcus sp. 06-156-4a]OZD28983.1 LysR family transcriptional regulator [Rhodococcus sp. 06-156-3b]OZD33539.1 LysR family transcriptional regulator [Rhodococcus sp. 06-156-3]